MRRPDAFARRLCRRAELCQLAGRVEHDVVGVLQQLLELVRPVGRAEHMVLLLRQLFPAKAALVQAAGLGARQIGCQHRVEIEVGKGLLRQQDAGSRCAAAPPAEFRRCGAAGLRPADSRGWAEQASAASDRFARPAKGGRLSRTRISPPEPGLWLSERGRPYLSRASRYGSGSNSSTVCTPLVVHLPVSSISAPHMAGTPVV